MFRKKIKWAIPLALIMTVVVFTVALAAVTVIDHFDVAQSLNLTCPAPSNTLDSVLDPDVLGGERDILAAITFCSTGAGALDVNVNAGGDSLFDYAAGSGVFGSAQIQWDGSADSPKDVIDYTGLYFGGPSGVDLTEGGTIDRFIVGVPENDLASYIDFTVYTDEFLYSTGRVNLPAGISVLNPQVFEILFSGFTQEIGPSGPADFTNVGAVVMLFGAASSSDTTLHLIGTADADYLDFSDLPQRYTTVLDPGPRNIIVGPRFGSLNTAETDGQPSEPANLDLGDDGVSPTPGFQWNVTDGGSVDMIVSDCPAQCAVSAWIDWNEDGNFFDTFPYQPDVGEKVFTDTLVTNGTNTVQFNIPVGTDIGAGTQNRFFTRFRLTERSLGLASFPTWAQFSGETEDYLLTFSPTAVELISVEANTNYAVPFALLAGALILLVSGGAILAYKRRRV